MSSDGPLAPNANDGTIEGAVAGLADVNIDNLIPFEEARDRVAQGGPNQQASEAWKLQNRQPDGKFTDGKKPAPKQAAQPVQPEAEVPAEAQPEADVSEPAEEYFELPPETEGGEPVRVKAEDVWRGYQERETLRAELEQVRRQAPPPDQWDQQILETVRERGQLVEQLQILEQMYRPAPPDMDLINPQSPRYNPDQYYTQLQLAQQQERQIGAIQQQRQVQQAALEREQTALREARLAREKARLREFWPEVVTDAKKANEVREATARYYGIPPQELGQVVDARLYLILKDALAYRADKQAQQAAVKVVRSKPKLVRGTARTGDTARQTHVNQAMQRLSRSGSIEDAANAIGGLL
ncbi:MAG: hypothetical protein RLZ85_691 [Verrucomicrobiota bacterium]|jgi:hypothetical protein